MKETANRYTIALLSVMMVCLLAVPAMADYDFDGWAPTTRTNGTINGTVFIDSVAWNGQTTLTLNTDVPDRTVKAAYLYTGIWGGTETRTGWVNVTFNGNHTANGLGPIHLQGENDNNDNVWCTGHGKYWIWYDVTNLTNAGQTNTAVTSKINGTIDGRVYGTVLVVVLEDDNLSAIQYWINDGSDGLNYDTPHNSGTTYFNGSVDTANVTTSALTVVHLTGYDPVCTNALDFNDHPLNTTMVDSNTFELNTWNNANSNVTPENVTATGNHADYRRCDDGFVNVCNAILVLNDAAIDLTVDDIDVGTPRPTTNFTVNATIRNWGSEGTGGHFNVSLYVDGVLNGTVNVTAGLSGGSSTTVSFEDVNLSKGCHEFKVFADCDNDITESIETNNNLTVNGQVGYVIVVECDDDFEKLNTSGDCALPSGCFKNESGTYYIQNLTIENCNGNGITIKNTNATFVINNCTIKNCTGSGVFLHDLKNGTINGSDILNNTKYGIKVGEVSLGSDDPEFVDITNNTINGSKTDGIDLVGFNCTVKDNTISNSTVYGIYLLANDTNITNGNKIRDNGNYGIKAYNSFMNNIYCNTFIDNNVSGHQAWDNGNTNNWNSTDADDDYTGNRWKDWKDNSGYPCNYTIDGGSNVDKRPKGLYDFLTGASDDKWAYGKQTDDKPPATNNVPATEFSSTDYGKIKADDGEFASSQADSGYYAAHRFNFSISEDPDDIDKINVTWNGKGYHKRLFWYSGDQGVELYVWNFTSGNYGSSLDSTTSNQEVTLTAEITESSHYIDSSGNVTVLVVQSDTSNSYKSKIETDYVRLVIMDP